jgi:enoyl-[acyl-carrier protein] reductase I
MTALRDGEVGEKTSNQIGPLPVAERPLAGRTALVVGVANKDSIAYGIARALRGFGADVAMTYLNDKTRNYTEELATALEQTKEKSPARALVTPEQIGNAVAALAADWGSIITGEVLHLDGGYNIMAG